MSEAQANQMISNMERTAQQAKETGEKAANITGATLIGLAISMLIGAIVGGDRQPGGRRAPSGYDVRERERVKPARSYASTR